MKIFNTLASAVALVVVAAMLMALPTQLLWNHCLVDAVDGTNQIGFFQALGINFLCSILFKPAFNTVNTNG